VEEFYLLCYLVFGKNCLKAIRHETINFNIRQLQNLQVNIAIQPRPPGNPFPHAYASYKAIPDAVLDRFRQRMQINTPSCQNVVDGPLLSNKSKPNQIFGLLTLFNQTKIIFGMKSLTRQEGISSKATVEFLHLGLTPIM